MSESMKLCKNCVHCAADEYCDCGRYISFVDGRKLTDKLRCYLCRDLETLCGVDARYFEAKKCEDKLRLGVNGAKSLCIWFGRDLVGYISKFGNCYFLTDCVERDAYEKWVAAGMPFAGTVVEWRGGKYTIDCVYQLRRYDIDDGVIYDFKLAIPIAGCQDPNIIRYAHNNTPILF